MMERSYKKVLVVGELNMDLILSDIAEFPQLDKEILSENMNLTLGSSSAIFASNLSSFGTSVGFIGKVGNDQFGEQIISTLKEKGIDVNGIIRSKQYQTGLTVSLNYGNKKANITYPGAMEDLSLKDIPMEMIKSFHHLHISSLFMQPKLKPDLIRLMRTAKDAGLTTSIDPQWDPEEKWDLNWNEFLPLVDFFMPNINELKAITGGKDLDESIKKIADFSNSIVIKMDTSGTVAWHNREKIFQPAFLNREVKDTIGAGDTFDAGFIHRFLKGGSIKESLEFGSICGAINTTAHGGTKAFQNKEEIIQIAKNKFNFHIDDL